MKSSAAPNSETCGSWKNNNQTGNTNEAYVYIKHKWCVWLWTNSHQSNYQQYVILIIQSLIECFTVRIY
jgi:hypothetical protein